MQRLKAFRVFFSLAALLFVAKPFFGFGAFNREVMPRIPHTVLVKSFTKRKPESLEDADDKAESVHLLLSNPILILLSAIGLLLLDLLPASLERFIRLTKKNIFDIQIEVLRSGQAYLLTGKLTI